MSRPIVLLSLLAVSLVLAWPVEGQAASHPRDGRFKELSYLKDPWYFVDRQNWYIRAPDKWTHFMGSYALTEAANWVVKDKVLAGALTLGLGLIKELDDAYREGWSRRDIYMDMAGIASATILPENVRFLAYYDDTAVMFRFSFIID